MSRVYRLSLSYKSFHTIYLGFDSLESRNYPEIIQIANEAAKEDYVILDTCNIIQVWKGMRARLSSVAPFTNMV